MELYELTGTIPQKLINLYVRLADLFFEIF